MANNNSKEFDMFLVFVFDLVVLVFELFSILQLKVFKKKKQKDTKWQINTINQQKKKRKKPNLLLTYLP